MRSFRIYVKDFKIVKAFLSRAVELYRIFQGFGICIEFSKDLESEERIDCSDLEEGRLLGSQQLMLIALFKSNKKPKGRMFIFL